MFNVAFLLEHFLTLPLLCIEIHSNFKTKALTIIISRTTFANVSYFLGNHHLQTSGETEKTNPAIQRHENV